MLETLEGVLVPSSSVVVQDCSLKAENLEVFRYDYPEHLTEPEKKKLLSSLLPVAGSAFKQDLSEGFTTDVSNHIFSSDRLLVVVDDEGVPVAFRMWDYITLDFVGGTDIAYLAGMCVHKDWQKQGIGESLLQYVLKDCLHRSFPDKHTFAPLPEAPYVALRTQNPVMKRCFDRATGFESYPRLDGKSIPKDIQKVGSKISEHLNDHHFNPDTLVSKGLYGHNLYGYYPVVNDKKYQTLFSQLSVEQGDAMVCVWRRFVEH